QYPSAGVGGRAGRAGVSRLYPADPILTLCAPSGPRPSSPPTCGPVLRQCVRMSGSSDSAPCSATATIGVWESPNSSLHFFRTDCREGGHLWGSPPSVGVTVVGLFAKLRRADALGRQPVAVVTTLERHVHPLLAVDHQVVEVEDLPARPVVAALLRVVVQVA